MNEYPNYTDVVCWQLYWWGDFDWHHVELWNPWYYLPCSTTRCQEETKNKMNMKMNDRNGAFVRSKFKKLLAWNIPNSFLKRSNQRLMDTPTYVAIRNLLLLVRLSQDVINGILQNVLQQIPEQKMTGKYRGLFCLVCLFHEWQHAWHAMQSTNKLIQT